MTNTVKRQLLRVNLTTQDIGRDIIPERDIRMFMGGRALGDIILYRGLTAGVEPFSPANQMVFCVGPLTGTQAIGSSRYIVHTKSPQTGLYMSGLAGGFFGPELRKAGYDVVIVEGKSEKPAYLVISDHRVELRDASAFWGMTTGDTQEFIKKELNDDKFRIACIGPAGENLVLYSAIISERRAVGRGGAGAVMGSKNLEAIAVKGTGKVNVASPGDFQAAVKNQIADIDKNPTISKAFPLYGSPLAMPGLNEGGIMPWRNWQDAGLAKASELYPQSWRSKYVKKDVRCAPPCSVKCGKLCLATEGPHAGVVSEGPEYEAEYALGTCCDITDQAAIIEADALCDQYGLDVISMGVSLAFAMECYERGIISKKETDGVDLKFGQAHLLAKVIRATSYGQGFGEFLAVGTRKMSEQFGRGSDEFAMHAKGMELGGYDPRGAKSLALVYAAGPRGGCHKSGGSCNELSFKELATGNTRFLPEGKAALCKASRERRVLADSAIMCIFPEGAVQAKTMMALLNVATGFNWSIEDLYAIGEKASNIERAFNVREGLRRSWDTLPKRLLEESLKSGPTVGQIVELETLLTDFYKICGWDIKTGIPTPEKLTELGLSNIAKNMEYYIKCRS
jgi:aldehyde:ferredoxin oxidoreductase